MNFDRKIWKKYGWQNGDQVDGEIFKKEIAKKVKGKLPRFYYYIFQDANFHSLNQALESSGKFEGEYGSDKAEADYAEYKNKGGRTWNL